MRHARHTVPKPPQVHQEDESKGMSFILVGPFILDLVAAFHVLTVHGILNAPSRVRVKYYMYRSLLRIGSAPYTCIFC